MPGNCATGVKKATCACHSDVMFPRLIGTWVEESVLAERNHWMLWLPVGFGIGICAYFQLDFEPDRWIALTAFVLFSSWVLISRDGRASTFALIVLIIVIGFAVAQWRSDVVSTPMLKSRIGPVDIQGAVLRIEPQISGAKLLLGNLEIDGLAPVETPNRIRLSMKGKAKRWAALRPGDLVSLRAVIRPPPPPIMPGAFDFQRHAFFKEIGAYGFVLGNITVTPSTEAMTASRVIEDVRLTIFQNIYGLFPDPSGAVAAALITGHRGEIPKSVLGIMRDAGIAHILAISGLHIGLVAGLVFASIRMFLAVIPTLGLRMDAKKIAASIAIAVALAYAVLAGLTVPTQRAFLMTGLILVGVLMERRTLTMRSVCWAASVILLCRPESLVSPGFQLSFAAVVALIAAYAWASQKRRERLASQRGRGKLHLFFGYFGSVVTTTLIAGCATAPFAIYHFQHAATFGMVANLVAVPLTAVWVMPSAIAAMLAMPLGLEYAPLWLMVQGIDAILASAKWVAALPGAAVDIPVAPDWALGCLTLGALWLALWQQRWRLLGVPFIIIGLIGPLFTTAPAIIIDGAARAVAIQTATKSFIISNKRRARFETANWQRRFGQLSSSGVWPTSAEDTNGDIRCDLYGCLIVRDGQRITISFTAETHFEDCFQSDLMISLEPLWRQCPNNLATIDRFDLWRHGTHAVYLNNGEIEVRSLNDDRGQRPWVVTNARRKGQ